MPWPLSTAAYSRGETDEFIAPSVIGGYAGAQDGDGFFCLNFRADRAREILAAIGEPDFEGFRRGQRARMVGAAGNGRVFGCACQIHDRRLSQARHRQHAGRLGGPTWLRQFRLAETEKYPHVTFFLNGGKEAPEAGEDRYMPKSPKVATYDLQPEMSSAR